MRSRFLLPYLLLYLFLLPVSAEPARPGVSDYVRLQKGAPSVLETAIVTMTGPNAQRLDLVSAVHLADASYYQQLNSKFRGYQAVLYELVLPEEMAGQPLPSNLGSEEGLSGIQSTLARSLGLTTQLEQVDYSAPNFIHADLSREGLSRAMDGRQESLLSYFQKAMASSGGVTNLGVSEAELAQLDFMAIMSGQANARDRKTLKKLLASALTSSDGVMAGMEDTAILAERNKAALKAVDTAVKGGQKKLALFYGAAHMPDLETRLRQKGWKRTGVNWLPAWRF